MKDYSKNIIYNHQTVKEALEKLNALGSKDNLTLFVLNDKQQLLATLTDGDVRRGLLAGKNIENTVDAVMFEQFRYLQKNNFTLDDIKELKKKEIELIPILNGDKKIHRIIDLSEKKTILPIDAVIMAGGMGKRLKPLTDNIPKPLLMIGDKPIMEHTIDRLNSFGVENIFITINHFGDQIENYFGDGGNKGLNINYVREDEPLGTIGSVALIKEFSNDYVLVMNADLLTDIDFEDFFRTFIERKAEVIVATIPYRITVPYAILETDDEQILSLKEKPTYTYYSNAGIYLIKRERLNLIPKSKFYNATDLMEALINQKAKVAYYPILSYWQDIGRLEDYHKAQEDIKHLKL